MALDTHVGNLPMSIQCGVSKYPKQPITLSRTLCKRSKPYDQIHHIFICKLKPSTSQYVLPNKESPMLSITMKSTIYSFNTFINHFSPPQINNRPEVDITPASLKLVLGYRWMRTDPWYRTANLASGPVTPVEHPAAAEFTLLGLTSWDAINACNATVVKGFGSSVGYVHDRTYLPGNKIAPLGLVTSLLDQATRSCLFDPALSSIPAFSSM